MSQVDSAELELIEEKVKAETERIEAAEERIEREEKKIKASERAVLQVLKGKTGSFLPKGAPFNRFELVRQLILRKISRKKLTFTLIVIIGVVLVWRGIWEISESLPILQYSVIALLVGIGILWLIERYTDLL